MSRFEKIVLKTLRAPTYPLRVCAAEDVADHYRRIRFAGPELLAAEETPPAFWIRLWIPAGGEEYQRAYTVTDVRRDDGTFACEFALHEGEGVASEWARRAEPGQTLRATVYGSKRFAVPAPAPEGYLLVGDPCSLPAINDILRALPEPVPAKVFLLEDHDRLPVAGGDVRRCGSPEEVLAAVRELGPLPGWHAWVATESALTRQVRGLAQDALGVRRQDVTSQGYWTRGRAMGRARR
ncbi:MULTISPECIES: siderophore-interacting protein [Amycolatopsis]|uniref:Siderophore-interacting protein n=1 Tax=Amycolatopsis tucumanensis TaxID=401106 RepID=A0ABP7JPG1_9PSEU|nr:MULTISPECIES: siderophore-interacting protein [Amycolatopsis]MCF6428366.1 siderophore-interacting protein [Amycolatopsis tucumanensis]